MLYEIAKTADVFLTNYLPAQRQKNRFDVEHIRAANPDIIYARGSAYGDKGPERDTGGFDGTAFWTRSGVGHALTPRRRSAGGTVAGHSGVRRLDRRHEHRRRDLGRVVPPDAHRRGGRDRRVTAQHRVVGRRGGQHDPGHGDRRDHSLADAGRGGPEREPVHGQLSVLRRRHDQLVHRQPDRIHPRRVRTSGTARTRRRPAVLRRHAVDRKMPRRQRN